MEQVTVIMAVYNAEQYLEIAIESVLNQTYKNFRLVIINDGSTDGSGCLIEEYAKKDSRIFYICQENRGMASVLNRGLEEAKTKWVIRMDGDDEMLPERIERQLDFLQANPDVKVASCRAVYIDNTGYEFGRTANHIKTRLDYQKLMQDNEAIGLLHPGVIMHRETILQVGGYRGQFWPAEDIDLWCRVAESGHLSLIQDEVLMKYRMHAGSFITAGFVKSRMQYEWVRASLYARRRGEPEPTWEDFHAEWRSATLPTRLNRWRKITAKRFYRMAGYYKLKGELPSAAVRLMAAAFLQPYYVVGRLKSQIYR